MRERRAGPPVLRKFGQHFLADRSALEAIASAIQPAPGDTVVEIGPGRGALTDLLAARPDPLIAIEIDRALSAALRERYADNPRVTIIENDVLEVDIASLVDGPFVVAGNVPYYITTPILFHVLKPPFPRHAVFLVQREVADRIVSPPGSRSYGALSVNVQALSNAEILRDVPPGAFRPPPRVSSAIIRVTPRSDPIISSDEVAPFRAFVQALFGMRRKQIVNGLRSAGQLTAEQSASVLDHLAIDPRSRPETLSPDQLAALMRASNAARS
ncbi:MAG: 16S rRNA (adenine(1518)-N(6)/adenine(1519)-N(6))-dimethyltransferase RsmA [Gemmatimonadaceae bacterium]|nr:16S rRNA (adenine(1518)-N(6)/adenine(1519)-N(6))-dimethyltransferase RsmA [Gemmatimonadaceae bacterium]